MIDFNRDFAELAEKEKSGVWGRALASLNNWKAIYFGVEWPKAAWSPCDDGDRDFLMLFAGPHSAVAASTAARRCPAIAAKRSMA